MPLFLGFCELLPIGAHAFHEGDVMSFDANRGVHISTGSGIVAHLQGLTAFADGEESELNTLVARLNALANVEWTEVVRTLTAEINAVGYDSHPTIACVSIEDDRVAAFVFGDTALSLVIDSSETVLDGSESSTWIDVTLHGTVEKVMAGAQSDSPIVGVLRDGVVPAGGFMLDTDGPMPASGRWNDEMQSEPQADVDASQVEMQVETASDPEVAEAESTPTAEPEPALEATPEPEPAPATPPSSATPSGVAADAASLAGSGLFTRLDQRIPTADEETEPAPSANEDETAMDESASVFDRPELIDDAQGESHSDEMLDQGTSDTAQGFAPPNDVEAAQPAEPSPVASLTQTRPQLQGVRCPHGHLTKPGGSPCMTCGARIEPDAAEDTGDRPPLGTLTFDDGAQLVIERPAAIGSDVPAGYSVAGEPATIIRLDDGEGGVDDLHLELRLSGWDVEIVDMMSNGGTYTVTNDERQTRTKMRSGQSITLKTGMTVEAGRRSFTYTVGPTPPTA